MHILSKRRIKKIKKLSNYSLLPIRSRKVGAEYTETLGFLVARRWKTPVFCLLLGSTDVAPFR
ncbi:hypothetical protein RchiOBHm_Chr4g0423031 [Rosa chinensis]|uniref:Uncharacterized protein n=1 Tax=Rosa chinensis TaxID=74649 RepID=A0A2P6QYM9_ROSCH|nr:hypothetical protein RchiOBHm_Chr4g0423031 [Rosa chinensis]